MLDMEITHYFSILFSRSFSGVKENQIYIDNQQRQTPCKRWSGQQPCCSSKDACVDAQQFQQ